MMASEQGSERGAPERRAGYRVRPGAPVAYRPRAGDTGVGATGVSATGAVGATTVVTLLTPDERLRVDAVGLGSFATAHREAMEDVVHELRVRVCAAVVLSVAQLARDGRSSAARVSDIVRAHPRVPVVGIVADPDPGALAMVLALGRAGVRAVVDARLPEGWRGLRSLLGSDPAQQVGREALARLAPELAGAGEGCLRFFGALFEVPPEPVTVSLLARRLGVRPTTLMSRFTRAELPSPKRYLALARLIRMARLLENRGVTLSAAADRLEYSSAQSFGRHVRIVLGVSAAEFRRTYDAERMLALFSDELVRPYRDRLRRFSPLGHI
jgi:AraC-like DNA-binding protein